ncbi:hypothetical protein PUNSTDRAFT_120857 [Punctularia strigosozonata HHB-11173 SS5]|uniref:uncharacterized protein n=1 Tax=Punctularia strigosozonata (strain HHB-11173) TaxID=741275 RepID=UPI0004417CBF|nr:uncharacterized protein PUNSTDRAFT_120857 [Punctularia strigosozonata HHB-11173 SS5]EIN08565.1 hypothetical protein PUNSTDRAFT_120857 [Punctularia strigosozonata HHB-11173 SS5]
MFWPNRAPRNENTVHRVFPTKGEGHSESGGRPRSSNFRLTRKCRHYQYRMQSAPAPVFRPVWNDRIPIVPYVQLDVQEPKSRQTSGDDAIKLKRLLAATAFAYPRNARRA